MPRDHTNQISLALGEPFANRGLFADHFLSDRIGELEQWKSAEGLSEAFAAIDKLYREKASRFRTTTNESQTERDFVRPVLDILWKENEPGDCYEVQVNIPNVDARRQPDYGFFRTAADRNNAENRKGTLDYWRDVPALGDAKAWFASLDRQRGVDENPSSQIANYLYRSRVRWGILTNGKTWRLYEREKSSAGGVFYEVDLEEILKRNDLNAFKYFYLFFRRAAFLPDTSGTSFIDHVFQGSIEYASEVGDLLKESVYDALRSLMNGFFEHSANSLDRNDPATVKLVHENSLIVLYRLLFLLYAEDGRLLPCDDEPYHSISLLVLHRQINENLRRQRPYLPTTTMVWGHVCNLFRLIDEGFRENEKVIIPAYNGGLFNPSHYPHIAHSAQPGERRWDIGDRFIAQAIDELAYERESWDQPGSQDIDYKTLDVRHLGSIYEGLLELQPHVADEALVETLDDGKPVFKPSREVPNPRAIRGQRPRTIETSEIYLTTNRGERKATGSYYTPKYIVDYIVENTVGPLVDEAARKVGELRPAIQREIRTRQRERKRYPSDAVNQIEKATNAIEEQKRLLLEPYLSLKILDPAMGSGHFLVGAADFLSLAMATDPNLIELDTTGDEDPQAHYKRLVVEHCLYGVDLNPLAVELAKLSLWLHTVSRDKALSFLDHHLRCGNSLVGARVEEDLRREPPQFNARGRRLNADSRQLVLGFAEALTATHLQILLDTFQKIVETPTGDAETERMKDRWYRDMDAVRDKFRAVANCWLAPFFGAPVTPQQYQEAVNGLRATIPEWEALKRQEWFESALAVAEDKQFFHWELEFPEVFFDARGFKSTEQRGFDVIIGNPPWVSLKGRFGEDLFTERELVYFFERYHGSTYMPNLFEYFVGLGITLVRRGGFHGLIVPDRLGFNLQYRDLRSRILETCNLISLLYKAEFPDVTVDTLIYILRRSEQPELDREVAVSLANKAFIPIRQGEYVDDEEHVFWYFDDLQIYELVRAIERVPTQPLGSHFESTSGFGGKSSEITATKISTDQIPVLKGENIYRYGKAGCYYFRFVRENITGRTTDRRKLGAVPKVLLRKTGGELVAAFDDSGVYPEQSLYFLFDGTSQIDFKFALALLNSKLINFYYLNRLITNKESIAQLKKTHLDLLPIRSIHFKTSSADRSRLLAGAKQLYERGLDEGDEHDLLAFVTQQLNQAIEGSDVIHDLLAFLAEQMMEMNATRQMEVDGFLAWLERHIGTSVDALTNKTQIYSYSDGGFSNLLSVLRTNQRKLGKGVDVSARKFQEELEREFNASVQKLQPLKANIEATDYLIDEIVFKLYGLTDEEISLVKGQSHI